MVARSRSSNRRGRLRAQAARISALRSSASMPGCQLAGTGCASSLAQGGLVPQRERVGLAFHQARCRCHGRHRRQRGGGRRAQLPGQASAAASEAAVASDSSHGCRRRDAPGAATPRSGRCPATGRGPVRCRGAGRAAREAQLGLADGVRSFMPNLRSACAAAARAVIAPELLTAMPSSATPISSASSLHVVVRDQHRRARAANSRPTLQVAPEHRVARGVGGGQRFQRILVVVHARAPAALTSSSISAQC